MAKTQATSNYIRLKPIKASQSIALEYQRKLLMLVDKMNDYVSKEINKEYITQKKLIAMDETPVTQFSFVLKRIFARMQKRFDEYSNKFSVDFVNNVSDDTKIKLMNQAQDLITIRPDRFYIGVLNSKKALINENVALIKNLPEKMYQQIYGDVMRAFAKGNNLSDVKSNLYKAGLPPLRDIQYSIKERARQVEKRAKLITRDQFFKATGIINNQRMADAGITKAEWMHSSAGKVPRPDHVKANGKIFDTAKGCLIDGEYILPGEKINCRCVAIPIIELN